MTVVAFIAALCCVLIAPAVAASRAGSHHGPVDLPVRLAYAFGGLGVASVSIWIAGWAWEINNWTVFGAPLGISALLLGARSGPAGRLMSGPRVIWIAALVIGVLVLVPFLPYGRVTAEGVHRMAMSDWYKHLMVTTVLEGGEFPPPNAFLADARAAPYYYGFHLVAAAIENVGRIGSTFWLLLAFTVLTAAAYPVVLFVVARDLFDDTRRAVTAAIGGSFLAGFDAAVWVAHAARDTLSAWPLPAGPAGLRAAVPMTSIDFWIHHNERQVRRRGARTPVVRRRMHFEEKDGRPGGAVERQAVVGNSTRASEAAWQAFSTSRHRWAGAGSVRLTGRNANENHRTLSCGSRHRRKIRGSAGETGRDFGPSR